MGLTPELIEGTRKWMLERELNRIDAIKTQIDALRGAITGQAQNWVWRETGATADEFLDGLDDLWTDTLGADRRTIDAELEQQDGRDEQRAAISAAPRVL